MPIAHFSDNSKRSISHEVISAQSVRITPPGNSMDLTAVSCIFSEYLVVLLLRLLDSDSYLAGWCAKLLDSVLLQWLKRNDDRFSASAV
jgi:hypothetical protein